jgi:membrane-associated phospholipid phosphatase
MNRGQALVTFVVIVMLSALGPFWAVISTEHLALHNQTSVMHTPWADPLFVYGTHIADGWVAGAAGLGLLLFSTWRSFLLLLCSTLGSSIVVQTLKHTVFADQDRPSMFLNAMPDIHLIAGVEVLHHNSFPSGHSTFAFSFCVALAILVGRSIWSIALALIAVFLACSRVYLSQHFTEDVLAGALIGTSIGALAYLWLYRSTFSRHAFLDRRPFRKTAASGS